MQPNSPVSPNPITPKNRSTGWLWAILIIGGGIYCLNAYGSYRDSQIVKQAAADTQAQVTLNQRCTMNNFMSSKDLVTLPGRTEMINARFSGASQRFDASVFQRSWNAWIANNCD